MTSPALHAQGLGRRFGDLWALRDVDVTLQRHAVHALVGENGAGKSTLAKIVAGALTPTEGTMELGGQPYAPRRRADGSARGVAHVRQQLSLVRGLTLAENLQLGRPGASVRFDRPAAVAELSRFAEVYDLAVRPGALVDDLPLADRQRAEILMAVAWGAEVLILDEPTSALGPVETDALLELCHRLRAEGTSLLYISHKLREVVALADRLTVLRQGRAVASGVDVAGAELDEIARLMIGERAPSRSPRRVRAPSAQARLVAEGLRLGVEHGVGLAGVDLRVSAGEIVGVVGVAGNGQEPLAECLVGVTRPEAGRVEVDGLDVTGSPLGARAAGVAYLPEERVHGLAMSFSAADNVTATRAGDPELSRWGLRRRSAIARRAGALMRRFGVDPPVPAMPARALSGGNQQKLLSARELEVPPAVLVAAGPTKGLDPGATAAMRDRLAAVAADGAAVVVISADLDEILEVAERVVVLSGGRIVDDMAVTDADPVRLGAAMAGVSSSDAARRLTGGDVELVDDATPARDPDTAPATADGTAR